MIRSANVINRRTGTVHRLSDDRPDRTRCGQVIEEDWIEATTLTLDHSVAPLSTCGGCKRAHAPNIHRHIR